MSRYARHWGIVVSAGAVLALVAGCGGSAATTNTPPPPPDAVASAFVQALITGDYATAAGDTDQASTALAAMRSTVTGLHPQHLTATIGQTQVKGKAATTSFTLNWDFGNQHVWSDATSLAMTEDKTGNWRIAWHPSVFNPQLADGDRLTASAGGAASTALTPVLAGDGSTLFTPSQVVTVNLTGTTSSVINSLASALSQFDNSITAQSITAGATKAAGSAYTVTTLTEDQYQKVKPQIYSLPGVTFSATTRLVGPTPTFGSALIPILRDSVSTSTPSGPSDEVSVVITQPDGSTGTVLYNSGGPAAPTTSTAAVKTTINTKVQEAAESALATVPQEAMAVVIQPSTGDLLAIAENTPASNAGDRPMSGLYPPGSTFKIITASAGFNAGTLSPQQSVACPGTTSIEGRTISNENKFDLGTTSVTNAFAQSCNTTFSQVAAGMSASTLPDTAKTFGLGVDYTIPGVTSNTGSITSDADELARAEDGFGQGKDQVSPFGMALVAATAERGRTPIPQLLAGQPAQSDTPPTAIPSATLSSLKILMRAVVTSGTGTAVSRVSPAVYGKTGTAQFGDGSQSHGWFAGYQGDLAFAFLLVNAGSSAPAVVVADHFFTALG